MSTPTTPIKRARRSYRRRTRYTHPFACKLTREQYEGIEAEAVARECSLSDVLRDAIDRGLPMVKASRLGGQS